MSTMGHYVIRGGIEGRERLRVLSRVLQGTTTAFLDRLGLRDGDVCADVGCGGGDVSQEIARRVAPRGRVIAFDIDEKKLELAQSECRERGIANVEFRVADVRKPMDVPQFDVLFSRCLLTHLDDPAAVLRAFLSWVHPGGIVALEDIDFSGYFTYPESPAFTRYHELYCATVSRRGGDPNIGHRLPALMQQCGFQGIDVHAVQPMGLVGEAKLLNPLTMENIAGAVLEDGLATSDEIAALAAALYAFAADPTTLAGAPRMVQVAGRRAN